MQTYRVHVVLKELGEHKEPIAEYSLSYEVDGTPVSIRWNAFAKFRHVISKDLAAYGVPYPRYWPFIFSIRAIEPIDVPFSS